MSKLEKLDEKLLALISNICGNDEYITGNAAKYIYYNSWLRNQNQAAMKAILKKGIAFLGSSELAGSHLSHPSTVFHHGNSDFNIILIGGEWSQSLLQTINIAALEKFIDNRKIILNLSPQWFEAYYRSEAFSARFLERNYIEFLKNPRISDSLKRKIAARVYEMLETHPTERNKIQLYNRKYIDKNLSSMENLSLAIYDKFELMKNNYRFASDIQKLPIPEDNFIKASEINFADLMTQSEKFAALTSSSNDFFINNNSYARLRSESQKNSRIFSSMHPEITGSQEFNDLRLLIEVCKETGLNLMIINIPANGRWYDYVGFPKNEREFYYQTIRDICKDYGINITDFADKEYEKFFLRDTMHLGFKGWVYIDEAAYKFYQD